MQANAESRPPAPATASPPPHPDRGTPPPSTVEALPSPSPLPSTDSAELLSDAWARNFHDDIAQYLTALQLGLRALREPASESDRRQILDKLEGLADVLGRELYQIIDNLRQSQQGGDLAADLGRIASMWAAYGTLKVETDLRNLARLSLPPRIRTAIVFIVKEAVTNAAKHAKVDVVSVRASMRPGLLRIAVRDRGHGFGSPKTPPGPSDGSPGGHGLRGMYENARSIGAVLLVRSRPNMGTAVLLEVPLRTTSPTGAASPQAPVGDVAP